MKADNFSRLDRQFQMWLYTVGMKRLLLRSTKDDAHTTRIDVLFQGVRYMRLPTLFDGLSVRLATSSERAAVEALMDRAAHADDLVFHVEGQGYVGSVVAAVMAVHEDELEYFDPSSLIEYVAYSNTELMEPPAPDTESEHRFDPTDPTQTRYAGYVRSRIPELRDTEVGSYIAGLMDSGPAAIEAASATISDQAGLVLYGYADRMASLAVRQSDARLVVSAVTALVVGGLSRFDQEALLVMPLIEDSALRIGIDPTALLNLASPVIGGPGTMALVAWLSRAPTTRSLSTMGYVQSLDDDGFRYRRER